MKSVTDNSKKRQLAARMMAERGLMPEKEAVLSQFGVTRIRDLSAKQLDDLIDGLRQIQPIAKDNRPDAPKSIRQLRSTVLSLLDDLGIKAKPGNWEPVNNYLMQPRIAGKRLDKMTEQELKDCAKRLRMVKKKRLFEQEEEGRLARDN